MTVLKLVTFRRQGAECLGVWREHDVVHVAAASVPALRGCDGSMLELIEGGPKALAEVRDLASSPNAAARLDHTEVELLAPLPRPRRNVFCVGKNYQDHIAEGDRAQGKSESGRPEWAQFFTKTPQAVIGPDATIPDHARATAMLDYEAELAAVVGKPGVYISPDKALDHIFGWTIANDVTARDIQRRHVQFFKGKTLDRTCPLGPWIIPAADLDASDLAIRLWVNGELRQDSRTSRMIFDIAAILEQLSFGTTLEPGDVILTGTPSGVGYAMQPPRRLAAGDAIEIEIEGIGKLRNEIVAEQVR